MSDMISISVGDIVMQKFKNLPDGVKGQFAFVFEVGELTKSPYGNRTFNPSAIYVVPIRGSLAKLTKFDRIGDKWHSYGQVLLYFNTEELVEVPPEILCEYEKLKLV